MFALGTVSTVVALIGAEIMRHLAGNLTGILRFLGAGGVVRRNVGVRLGAYATLVALPILAFIAIRALGLHVGAGLYGQVWLAPLLVSTVRWGLPGAALVGAFALATLDPVVARFVLASDVHVTAAEWIGQATLYAVFALSARAFTTLARHRAPTQPEFLTRDGVSSTERSVDRDRVLASLANAVEIRDRYTQGHCRRVARNALVMGKALDLPAEDLNTLYWAATLHDLGKIAVPEYILLKTGRLSEEEYAEIRRHPMYGADLLCSVSQSYRQIADVVRAHHERWDGLGYPVGARRHEIPEMARIIAIVDVFEALTSERPYRSPMPESQALQYIKNGAGTQFDPHLVEEFCTLFLNGQVECANTSTTASGVRIAGREPMIAQSA